MANCGIKKYDELPGVVNWTDVDYLRFRLGMNIKERIIILDKLNGARKKWNQKLKKKN